MRKLHPGVKRDFFNSEFMPSLFQQAGGVGHGKWLTRKQTNVCCKYMHKSAESIPDYGVVITYDCQWQGRRVIMSYYKQNGCGHITFGPTEAEEQQAIIDSAIRRAERRQERLNDLRTSVNTLSADSIARRVQRLEKLTSDLISRLYNQQAMVYYDIKDNLPASDIEWKIVSIAEIHQELEFTREQLAIYQS